MILGLQDRGTRDRAAEWMEGDEAGRALRLWRSLARRCVGPYGEHAAAPLTLAGWVAWSTGDELEAREALAMALAADPDYLFARLLHQACNEGLDPEAIRSCLRAEREDRARVGPQAPAGRTTDSDAERNRAVGLTDEAPGQVDGAVVRADGPRARADASVARTAGCGATGSETVAPRHRAGTEPMAAAVPSRRRRRPRSADAAGGTSGRTRAGDGVPDARVARRRRPPGAARPAGTARTSWKAAMPCADTGQEGTRPGHGTEVEE